MNRIKYQSNEKSISFMLQIEPNENYRLNISFQQQFNNKHLDYILISTQLWAEPLVKADYILIMPDTLEPKGFNYTPDSSQQQGNKKIFFWHKENFMPKEDFEIWFE